MREKEPLIIRILKKLHIIQEKELTSEEQNSLKKEMCQKAEQQGICNHSCYSCAWNDVDFE